MTAQRALQNNPCVVWCWTSDNLDAPAQARIAFRCALSELGFDCEVIGDAVLVVSELVTNATRYVAGPYELRLRRCATEVICEVEDHDPRVPEISPFSAEALYNPSEEGRAGGPGALCAMLLERGRGLHIVHELTKGAWGFCSRASTKTAWFALPCPRRKFGQW